MEREIIDIVRDGEEKTAIWIGSDDLGIPKHLMQGEKQSGVVSDGSTLRPWIWDGLCAIDGERYVYFAPCRLRSIYEIATSARSCALRIVRNLAFAIMQSKLSFLDLVNGVLPLYRIWIMDDCDVLLLPPDLGDVFAIMRTEERREAEVNGIIQSTAEKNFLLITEMAELLYYAASGRFPFASEEVRGSGYKEAPIAMYEKLPERTEGFISFIFHARSREMRDIMGNREGGENLSWFLRRSEDLEWGLPDSTDEEQSLRISRAEGSEAYRAFFDKRRKISRRNAFWRVQGAIIITVTVVAISVGSFIGNWIWHRLQPPMTKDLEPMAIIEAFYDAQSDCLPEEMSTALKGCSAPQEMEVTNLYVMTRTRFAYEAFDPLVNARDWVAEGKPALPEGSIVYGVVVNGIEETGENEYVAHCTWYTPFSDSEEEMETVPGTLPVYVHDVDQSFSFTWNSRGWWNITATEIEDTEFIGVESVDAYPIERKI